MKRNKAFTVSIRGSGRLLGMVVSRGMEFWPRSTWYDHSAAMKRAVTLESQIADSGAMRPQDVPSVRKAMANQKSPRKTDVVLFFSTVRKVDVVKIVAGRKSETITFDERTARSVKAFDRVVDRIVKRLGAMA